MEKQIGLTRRKLLQGMLAVAVLAMLPMMALAAPSNTTPETSATPLPLVSPIFGDNMVLQRGKTNTIWGWSEPGDKIRVEIAGKSATGVAGADRRWQVKIQPPRRRWSVHGNDHWPPDDGTSQRVGWRRLAVRRPIQHEVCRSVSRAMAPRK